MDPKDYERHIISLRSHIHEDDLILERLPEHFMRARAGELQNQLEHYIKEACCRSVRSSSHRIPEMRVHEIRAEIAIMPAEDLRILLGFVGVLQKESQAGRCGKVVKFLEGQE